jgi:epoxyqueuosine reductase
MTQQFQLAEELIAEAEKINGFRAGIATVDEVLAGPSYKAPKTVNMKRQRLEEATVWLPNAHSLLVLAMHHPEEDLQLDSFERGNSAGNRRMMEVSEKLVDWLIKTHGVRAQPLPYHVEAGGVYLKDAAVFAGLGVVGKNNLLLDRIWGASVRLRTVLIEGSLPSSGPLKEFNPCRDCAMPCRKVCPENAFGHGHYDRPTCIQRMESDKARSIDCGKTDSKGNPIRVIYWCRRCEFACPVGGK